MARLFPRCFSLGARCSWLLLAGLAVGCGARTAPLPTPAPAAPAPAPAPDPEPAPEPGPPVHDEPAPPPRPLPTASDGACVVTHDGACVPADEFNAMATERASAYETDPGFEAQWGLEAINAHLAYGQLELLEGPSVAPGEGVTIGLIDTGIDEDHSSFRGRTLHEEMLFGATQETGDGFSHGTAVASIAAGNRLGSDGAAHGVAWGADLAVFAIPLGSGDGVYRPIDIEDLGEGDASWAGLFGDVLGWRDGERRLDVLNLSFGYQGLISGYSEADLRQYFSETIASLAQAESPDPTILVWAAGNSWGDSCEAGTADCPTGTLEATNVSVMPGLVARIPELQGHSIAVVALEPENGWIADFSNRCGLAADFCIAAPGSGVRVAYWGPDGDDLPVRGFGTGGGTSFAAPMVSGGLALMKQLFRGQLSNRELVSRLFQTADRRGIYADREIYGNGRLDLGAATSPFGLLDVPSVTGVRGGAPGATGLRLGMAFGAQLPQVLGEAEVMALDDLGAPFWFSLGDFAVRADGPSLSHRFRSFLAADPRAGSRFEAGVGQITMPALGGTGHFALAEGAVAVTTFERGGLSATAFATGALRAHRPASGATVRFRPDSLPLGVAAGWVSEPDSLLGTVGQGAFGRLSAGTGFLGVDGDAAIGRWSLAAQGEVGITHPGAGSGMVGSISRLTTSAFTVEAGAALPGGSSLRLSLSQPLRVEAGSLQLIVPAARTPDRRILHRPLVVDLAAPGRQLDLAARWLAPLPLGELRLGAVWTRRPEGLRLPGPDVALLSGWVWTF